MRAKRFARVGSPGETVTFKRGYVFEPSAKASRSVRGLGLSEDVAPAALALAIVTLRLAAKAPPGLRAGGVLAGRVQEHGLGVHPRGLVQGPITLPDSGSGSPTPGL